jgi:hypothetical protein
MKHNIHSLLPAQLPLVCCNKAVLQQTWAYDGHDMPAPFEQHNSLNFAALRCTARLDCQSIRETHAT